MNSDDTLSHSYPCFKTYTVFLNDRYNPYTCMWQMHFVTIYTFSVVYSEYGLKRVHGNVQLSILDNVSLTFYLTKLGTYNIFSTNPMT